MLCSPFGRADGNGAAQEYRRGIESASDPETARRHFELAADAYAASTVQHSHRFLNESRAAWLAGRLPQAILACRRGLIRDPGNLDLRRQLAFLHDTVPGTRAPSDFTTLPGFPGMPPPALLAPVFGLAWTAAWICVLMAWSGSNRPWRNRAVACMSVALLAGGLWCWHLAIRLREQSLPLLVVARDFQTLHQGNGESYPAPPGIAPLRVGMELRLEWTRGDWLKVRRSDGVHGWVPRAAVLLVPEGS
jgi:hypothetical protein